MLDLEEYGEDLAHDLTEAWESAREAIKYSQAKQKKNYDQRAKTVFKVGDRVFLYKKGARSGKAYKFSRPFHGPYRILELTANDAKIRPVDKPQAEPIFVALDRLRRCPEEIGDDFWPPKSKTSKQAAKSTVESDLTPAAQKKPPESTQPRGVWKGRLRDRFGRDAAS